MAGFGRPLCRAPTGRGGLSREGRYGAGVTRHRSGDERTVMEYQLEAQRTDLAALLDGRSEEEASARLVPSLTTPLGLVTHAIVASRCGSINE